MAMQKTWLTACALIVLLNARAQETGNEISMDPVSIAATVTPQKTSRTGRNVFIIEGKKLQDLPVHSIDELLRYLPGLEVQARGPMGAQSDILMRGGTFQQVLVVLDGVRLNDPNTGHFNAYIPIAPAEIERIEILKGASSAIYGTEAVGGVIHIVTRTFGGKKEAQLVQAAVTAGGYALLNGQAGGFIKKEKTAWGGGILTNNAKGQPQRGTTGFLHNHTASFSVSHALNAQWQLGARAAYDRRSFSAQNFYTSFVSDTASEKVSTAWTQAFAQWNGAKHTVRFTAGFKHLKDRYAFNASMPPNESTTTLAQFLATDAWQVNGKLALVSGLQYINKGIASNDRGEHTVQQAAGFLLLHATPVEGMLLSPAIRLEYHARSGWEAVPQLAWSYHRGSFQLRGSAGRTIRDADFTERFNNFNKALVTSGRIGNPGLEAEESFSYEGGGDLFLSSFRLSLTYFSRHHSGLIDYVTTAYADMPRKDNLSPTGTYLLARNISKVHTRGLEADLGFEKVWKRGNALWATAGLVWLESSSADGVPSLYIASHARYLVNFNLQYKTRWATASLNGIYKERNMQEASHPAIAKVSKDYAVFNLRIAGAPWKGLVPFIQADNIFNTAYTDLLGAPMPRRWLMGGIQITLSK